MRNFSVTIDKLTRWNIRDKQTGITKKFWNKQDAEDYLDWQENLRPKTKSRDVQTQERKAE